MTHSTKHFYVAAALRDDALVSRVYAELRRRGGEITYDWVSNEGRMPDWTPQRQREVAQDELRGVCSADSLIFIAPGGRGAHVELGAALGMGIPVLMCYGEKPKPSLFYEDVLITKFPMLDPEAIAAAAFEMMRPMSCGRGTIEFDVIEWEKYLIGLMGKSERLPNEDNESFADRIKYTVFGLRDHKGAPPIRWT